VKAATLSVDSLLISWALIPAKVVFESVGMVVGLKVTDMTIPLSITGSVVGHQIKI